MRYFSVFTGAGGFEQGLPQEWECIGFSEIDKYCNMVLKYHYPNVKNYGDINAIRWNEIPDFDMLIGGSPCQDVSISGKRKGLGGERSGLFFQYVNVLKQKKPDYFIWENVEGMLSSNGGWDFAKCMLEFSEAGYDFQYQILNSKYFGVPQNRERIFVVGHSRIASAEKVFFKQEYDNLHYQKNRSKQTTEKGIQSQISSTLDARYGAVRNSGETYIAEGLDYIGAVMGNKNKRWSEDGKDNSRNFHQGYRVYSIDGIATTLSANAGGWGGKTGLYMINAHQWRTGERGNGIKEEESFTLDSGSGRDFILASDNGIRRLTPLESERIMGWQDGWTKYGIDEQGKQVEISDTQRYKMCGNGVVSNVVKELVKALFSDG